MSDDALISWLAGGAPVALPAEEQLAKRRREFVFRFIDAITPLEDLGHTCEQHEEAIARNVYAIHKELNAMDQTEYDAVWLCIDAPSRRAIKAYIEIGKKL